jgi:hypothetical protein
VQANCTGSGNSDNEWKMQYRTKWWANTTKTVEWWGENENVLTLGGSIVYRLIAEAMFNVTNSTGLRYGTRIETVTSTQDYGPEVEVATSGGQIFVTC